MDSQTADGLVGTRVRQYEIVGKLGGGGMGIVYAARDARLGRLVALKFLPHQWCHDESAKERFIREAQAASAADHPNICTIHDIESTDDGRLFIVMAHYQGQTLKQKLEAGALPIEEALEIGAQVAEGLAKAHAQGIVHRDIKPGNLMVTDDGVRILDFGLAKLANSLQLTMEGSTIGTVAYMSPEQVKGEEADSSSDIWAVGVVLYEMLSGGLPFKGAYAEAIAHAIKNDAPPPLRVPGREIPEDIEQFVFRALHKDPRIRFQSARDMARAIRRLQGRTLPLDLRTEPLPPLAVTPRARKTRWWKSRVTVAAGVGMLVAALAGFLWLFSPANRLAVAVAPVINQTGYAELDPYRSALTQELIAQLSDSPYMRVLSYERLLQIGRPFKEAGRDVSSREAMQALTATSGARVIVVPTLLYENGGWRARVDFRRADTATNEAGYETTPIVSSLIKDTAYGLIAQIAAGVEAHFRETAPLAASVSNSVVTFMRPAPAAATRFRNLDAAAAFEQGRDAYDQLEYAAALQGFARAAERDSRNPLALAWQSRVARVMRRDDEAIDTAERARRLLGDETPADERLLVEAIAAESAREMSSARSRYDELAKRRPDDPSWLVELAGFQDRQGMNAEAIASYHEALRLDPRLARAHLELCRLYNRTSESARAKEEGQRALADYRALGTRDGQAQSHLCLTDTLRTGSDVERAEASVHASAALEIFRDLKADYNIARADHYVALVEGTQGNFVGAAASWEQALQMARAVGNTVLQSVVLMNLGVTYDALGDRRRALEMFRESSRLHELLGNEREAARSAANAGRILIEYGGKPDEGLRDLRNALGVFRKTDDKSFEAFAAQIEASYYRNAGQHAAAERQLNRAIALAKERSLDEELSAATVGKAISLFERNDYAEARRVLMSVSGNSRNRYHSIARLYLGRVYTRLGSFDEARRTIDAVALQMERSSETGLLPLLYLSQAEVAHEVGRTPEARQYFQQASALWVDDFPDPASVEARCSLGAIDAIKGRAQAALTALRASREQARRMGRAALEARCVVRLAQVEALAGPSDEALGLLEQIPSDTPERGVGPELQAQAHFWRSRLLVRRGNLDDGERQAKTARTILDALRASLPEADRTRFNARPEIRLMGG